MYVDDPHLMVAFATLPEAIYHAHKVEACAVKILHVRPRGDLVAPSCEAMHIFDLSTPAACDLVQLPAGTARSNAIECGMWLVHKSPRFSALVEHAAPRSGTLAPRLPRLLLEHPPSYYGATRPIAHHVVRYHARYRSPVPDSTG